MEFRILGPLEVMEGDDALPLGPPKQRALLAFLLLNANHAVPLERLVDELWGDDLPARAVKSIQTYVSRLRKVLPAGTLLTRPPGYALEISPEELDLHRFERELSDGHVALVGGKPATAAASLRRALELWRGPALAEFSSEPFAGREGSRLEELRLLGLEDLIEADLALGHHADLVGELESLVAHHPLRERFRGQLMLALYRSGRQAEALAAYRDARRLLIDELGIDPSRSLQDLEKAILQQDLSLDLPSELPDTPHSLARATREEAEKLGGFVGREHELGRLRDALDAALSGSGRLVMLSGEPGIGKTRTALELATHARLRGAHVLWGRCYEGEGAPPYWPWVQAIRSYVRECDLDQLRSEMGTGAQEIAEVVPDVRERLPDLEEKPTFEDPQQARFRLFDSLTAFLKSAARTQPLVLVLDDLHCADEGSLRLLEFVARELAGARLLLIGTYRDVELSRRHPLSQTLAELTREHLFDRLLLRGLNREDVGHFVEDACGISPPAELVRAVHTQTEGNPLFVSEVVRLLVQEDELTPERLTGREGWSVRIPEGVREVIGRRLERLSERCNETLAVASVIGREFELEQLERLIGDLSEDRLLEVLEEALSARVIEELPRAPGRYQFTHALIQETLADELSLTRRVRLHARIAEALEELYGEHVDHHAAELAHHFGEAQTLLGPEQLIRYSLSAGESALAAHAPEQALVHFERALAAKGDQAMDDETAALHFGLGRAQLATLPPREWEPTITSMHRAFEYYAEAADMRRAVAVAAYPFPLAYGIGQTKMAALIAQGLTLVPPDSLDEGRLLSTHGWLSGFIEGDYEDAQQSFRRALAIAERQDDAALERRTLAHAAFVDLFHLRWQDSLTKGLRAIELARDAGDLHNEMAARRVVGWAATATGEREQARLHAAAALALAEQLRERWWLVSTSFNNGLLSLYEGDWRAVREMGELGLTAQPSDPRHLMLRAVLEYELGEYKEGRAYVDRLQEAARSVPPPGPTGEHVWLSFLIPLVSRIVGVDDGLGVALAAAERLLSVPRLAPGLAMGAKGGLALIAVQRGDANAAERLYGAVESQRGTASLFAALTSDRLLGLLALTFGRVDTALAHFEDGLAFCDRAGYRPERAWTACDYAEALLARGGPGDRDKAVALQDVALAIARELEMRPLMERILARREILTA
ncbi:MAG: ATP-binding protein [Gaiellaceae bacterium]